jgi:hypothetical protein
MNSDNNVIDVVLVEEDAKKLALVASTNHLPVEAATSLQQQFAPLFRTARETIDQTRGIVVKDANDKLAMKMAREGRLALKKLRVEGDHLHKRVKEDFVRRGRAIDGFRAILIDLIETEEKRLEEQEKFVERQESLRKEELRVKRTEEAQAVGLNPALYQLGEMSDEVYQQLIEGARLQKKAAEERRQKEDAERIERERKAAEEQERVRQENERLKREAEERTAKEQAEIKRLAALHATRGAELVKAGLMTTDRFLSISSPFLGLPTDDEWAKQRAQYEHDLKEAKRLQAEREEHERQAKFEREKREAAEKKAKEDAARAAKEQAAKDAAAKKEREAAEAAARKEREETQRQLAAAEAERKRIEKEMNEAKAAREKERAERLEAERIAEEKRKKEEAMLKAKEAQAEAERLAAAKKAAAAPDKEKLLAYATAIHQVPIPELSTADAKKIGETIQESRNRFVAWVISAANDKI